MAKLKAIQYQLIPPSEESEQYKLLTLVRQNWHEDLQGARIALAWRKEWTPDRDMHLVLGKCHKISDLHKELEDFDFIIILNREVWSSPHFTEEKKAALLDHELSHATVDFDSDGDPKRDERGRLVFRTRKHDIEEFRDVAARHGCYKRDLEEFAEALLAKDRTPLFSAEEDQVVVMQKRA